jgi:phosphoglycerol transferase MdoB-like AlkP superfamily enzyme
MTLTYDGPYLNPPSNEGPDYKNRFYKYYANMSEFKSFPRERINENYVGQLNGSIPTYFSPTTLKQGGMERYWDDLFMLNDYASLAKMAAQNAIVDDGVGKVMDALKRKGMMNNTLVIFSTDQGNYIGQHGLIGHGFQSFPARLDEQIMRIPLVMVQPGVIAQNRTTDKLASEVDIAPTILDYVGLGNVKFDNSSGRSFAKFIKGENMSDWRQEVYYEQTESRGISTKDFSL